MPFLSWSSHQRQGPALAGLSQSQGLLLLCRELLGPAQLCLGQLSKVAPGAGAAPGAGHTLCSPEPEALAEEEESRLGRKGQSSRLWCCPGAAAPLSSREGLREGDREGRESRAQQFPQLGTLALTGLHKQGCPWPQHQLGAP